MKNQKNLVISLTLIILQIGIAYLHGFLHLNLPQSMLDLWFFGTALISIIFSVISLVKQEANLGPIILIMYEIYISYMYLGSLQQ